MHTPIVRYTQNKDECGRKNVSLPNNTMEPVGAPLVYQGIKGSFKPLVTLAINQ